MTREEFARSVVEGRFLTVSQRGRHTPCLIVNLILRYNSGPLIGDCRRIGERIVRERSRSKWKMYSEGHDCDDQL